MIIQEEELNKELYFILRVYDNNTLLATYMLVQHNEGILEAHTNVEVCAYGSSVEITKEAMKYVFSTKPTVHTILTKVPSCNALARRLAKKVGMIYFGTIPNSFMKEDKMIAQEYYYISRGEK